MLNQCLVVYFGEECLNPPYFGHFGLRYSSWVAWATVWKSIVPPEPMNCHVFPNSMAKNKGWNMIKQQIHINCHGKSKPICTIPYLSQSLVMMLESPKNWPLQYREHRKVSGYAHGWAAQPLQPSWFPDGCGPLRQRKNRWRSQFFYHVSYFN